MRSLTEPPACDTSFNPYSNLPAIEACQREAKTPYCWPPNGTQICVPANDVPFYWPPEFYRSRESGIDVTYGIGHDFSYQNTGNLSLSFTRSTWYTFGKRIPGRIAERTLNISIREVQQWRDEEGLARADVVFHQGPIITLIDAQRTAVASARPSATGGYNYSSSFQPPNEEPDLAAGGIAGIVFGGIIGVVMLGMLCFACCKSCCVSGGGKIHKAEGKRIRWQQNQREQSEMDQGKLADVSVVSTMAAARSSSFGTDEIRAVEEQRIVQGQGEVLRTDASEPPPYEAVPPKYTP